MLLIIPYRILFSYACESCSCDLQLQSEAHMLNFLLIQLFFSLIRKIIKVDLRYPDFPLYCFHLFSIIVSFLTFLIILSSVYVWSYFLKQNVIIILFSFTDPSLIHLLTLIFSFTVHSPLLRHHQLHFLLHYSTKKIWSDQIVPSLPQFIPCIILLSFQNWTIFYTSDKNGWDFW